MRPHFFHHLHPPTVPAAQARWLYTLGAGGTAIFLMLILSVTGILEMFQIVSRPGLRVNCEVCGEEIMNEREILREGLTLCCTCAGHGYYQSTLTCDFQMGLLSLANQAK